MKNKVLYVMAVIGILSIVLIIIPIAAGALVSIDGPAWLETENEWIGFWGGYLGSLVGVGAAIYVMKITILHEKEERKRREKIEFCLKINEYIMEYSGLVGDYNPKSRPEITHNVLIKYSGIINSMLGAILKNKNYKGVKELIKKSEAVLKIIDLYENSDESNRSTNRDNLDNAVDELRKCSSNFIDLNIIEK